MLKHKNRNVLITRFNYMYMYINVCIFTVNVYVRYMHMYIQETTRVDIWALVCFINNVKSARVGLLFYIPLFLQGVHYI